MPTNDIFDKYAAYAESVQSPKDDAKFLSRVYGELVKREPILLREDFCAAFELCCKWVTLDSKKKAIGLDLDPEPLTYGKRHYLPRLREGERSRIKIYQRDVLSRSTPKADIICAFNFSYYIFHTRSVLLQYFKQCRRSLLKNGILAVDIFGGPRCGASSVDVRKYKGLTYYWQQENFDPINNHAKFHIHFKPKNGRKRNRVFSYDWRMWSIPEIRDLMMEAGFRDVVVYWEGTAKNGSGSGKFYQRRVGEPCEVWLAYVIGIT